MSIKALLCPHCGAPVAPSALGTITCAYCMHTLTGVPEALWAARLDATDDDIEGRLCCRLARVRYAVRGLLARGERSDVLLAERVRGPTELVVLKVLRGEAPAALGAAIREFKNLTRLAASETGGAFFATLVPQPIAVGALESRDFPERPAIATRWRSGFQHTLVDVRRAYPNGVAGRTVVWMWRRVLDLLTWVHACGLAHGSVLPEHVLIHPRDHGAILVGWSHAAPGDARLRALDVAMSARSFRHAVTARSIPGSMHDLLLSTADGKTAATEARALSALVLRAATAVYGPPAFHPFIMPS